KNLRLALAIDAPDTILVSDEEPALKRGNAAGVIQAGGERHGFAFVEDENSAVAVFADLAHFSDVDLAVRVEGEGARIVEAGDQGLGRIGESQGRRATEDEADPDGLSHWGPFVRGLLGGAPIQEVDRIHRKRGGCREAVDGRRESFPRLKLLLL